MCCQPSRHGFPRPAPSVNQWETSSWECPALGREPQTNGKWWLTSGAAGGRWSHPATCTGARWGQRRQPPGAWLCGVWEAALAFAVASAPAGYLVPVSRAAGFRAWKTGKGECPAGRVTRTPAMNCGVVAVVTSHCCEVTTAPAR